MTRPFWSLSGRECLLIHNQGGKAPWEAAKAQERNDSINLDYSIHLQILAGNQERQDFKN